MGSYTGKGTGPEHQETWVLVTTWIYTVGPPTSQ